MTRQQEPERGYEALLKPIQDVIAKDFKCRLKVYLDLYIEHLHKLEYINFSEAAIIVQNTCAYYCKRVDLMYNWVRQFCMTLNKNAEEEASEDARNNEKCDNNNGKKKKSNKNPHHLEELEVLPFLHSKKPSRISDDKYDAHQAKLTLLNTNSKATSKPGTSATVYQLKNEEMGYKDEFRIHIKVMNNGRLYPDIVWTDDEIIREVNDESFDDMVVDDIFVRDDNFDHSMDVDLQPPSIGNIRENSLPLDEPNATIEPSDQVDNLAEKVDEVPPFEKIIPFASLINHLKFKKFNVFALPPEFIEEFEEANKKKKKSPKKPADPSCHLSFSELLGGKTEDMICYRLRKRESERLKALRALKNTAQIPPTLNNDVDDGDHHGDFDDSLSDLRDGDCPPLTMNGINRPIFGLNIEKAFEESNRLDGINRKRGDVLAVQRKVAEWHNMIEPALKEAEHRSKFDVHEYGSKILAEFHHIGEEKDFSQVTHVQDKKDVCRYMLSTLMLANTYNVKISKSDPSELSKDCIQLKLLSTVRHHEELDANIGETAAPTT